jgi:hypothetical protein
MPIQGFPDAARHKICFRCHQWFEPDEGDMILPGVGGPVTLLRNVVAQITGDESMRRFMCHRCQRIRHVTKMAIGVALAIILGIIAVAHRLPG